ncbi:unnamed protein product [Spodoptera exigua]|nr:unnamed protein product [Spodoptera exigua]
MDLGNDSILGKKYLVYFVKSPFSKADDEAWICAGAIVSPTQILTAAACLVQVDKIYAIAGYKKYVHGNDIENDECTKRWKKKIVKVSVPKEYRMADDIKPDWTNIDLGVATVDEPYNFTDLSYQTFCSYEPQSILINYDKKNELENTRATALGWGGINVRQPEELATLQNKPQVLKEASTTIIDKELCLNLLKGNILKDILSKYMLCASGNGLVVEDGDETFDGCSYNSTESACVDAHIEKLRKRRHKKINETDTVNREPQLNEQKGSKMEAIRSPLMKTCQNDHGGPLTSWVGTQEVVLGVALNGIPNPNFDCIGPRIYVSTAETADIIKCLLETNETKRNICNNDNKEHQVHDIEILWPNDTPKDPDAESNQKMSPFLRQGNEEQSLHVRPTRDLGNMDEHGNPLRSLNMEIPAEQFYNAPASQSSTLNPYYQLQNQQPDYVPQPNAQQYREQSQGQVQQPVDLNQQQFNSLSQSQISAYNQESAYIQPQGESFNHQQTEMQNQQPDTFPQQQPPPNDQQPLESQGQQAVDNFKQQQLPSYNNNQQQIETFSDPQMSNYNQLQTGSQNRSPTDTFNPQMAAFQDQQQKETFEQPPQEVFNQPQTIPLSSPNQFQLDTFNQPMGSPVQLQMESPDQQQLRSPNQQQIGQSNQQQIAQPNQQQMGHPYQQQMGQPNQQQMEQPNQQQVEPFNQQQLGQLEQQQMSQPNQQQIGSSSLQMEQFAQPQIPFNLPSNEANKLLADPSNQSQMNLYKQEQMVSENNQPQISFNNQQLNQPYKQIDTATYARGQENSFNQQQSDFGSQPQSKGQLAESFQVQQADQFGQQLVDPWKQSSVNQNVQQHTEQFIPSKKESFSYNQQSSDAFKLPQTDPLQAGQNTFNIPQNDPFNHQLEQSYNQPQDQFREQDSYAQSPYSTLQTEAFKSPPAESESDIFDPLALLNENDDEPLKMTSQDSFTLQPIESNKQPNSGTSNNNQQPFKPAPVEPYEQRHNILRDKGQSNSPQSVQSLQPLVQSNIGDSSPTVDTSHILRERPSPSNEQELTRGEIQTFEQMYKQFHGSDSEPQQGVTEQTFEELYRNLHDDTADLPQELQPESRFDQPYERQFEQSNGSPKIQSMPRAVDEK